ncbi:MAG: FIST C-terminal domain-containing protein [Labilithrix sp.]|nr:FIST C-terminal domain-containing protein [Labilithrix sp.]MBX3220334.1 FIST C-terminal domain-containing protein [Labilithrix sp.]
MSELEVKRGVSRSSDPVVAAQELFDAVYDAAAALTIFYCSPAYDLEALGAALKEKFGDVPLIGCTTAGEITPFGYVEGTLTGVSIIGAGFRAATVRVDDLSHFQIARGDDSVQRAFGELRKCGVVPSARDTFAFLLADGLSMQEEVLVSSISRNLGSIQLFGGSAGDGTRFGKTYMFHEGAFRTDCALLTVVHTEYPFEVFKTQHFVAASEKMVVTAADPARRIVTEINGQPAASEYARVMGMETEELTPFVFARHPVVVRVGGTTYVRSIQKVNDDGSLTFFCAIDDGIVLTVAKGVDMVQNLADAFESVRRHLGPPTLVLGCDCILRRLEIEELGLNVEISELMTKNGVVGFATYGEQYNAMHVNQTFTGVAIGAKRDAA